MKRSCIICVGDDRENRASVAEVLRRRIGAAHDVLCFVSGTDAKFAAARLQQDGRELALVLCDESLSDLPADAFLIEMQSQFPSAMKVLLTEVLEEESLRRAINQGGLNKHLRKPWDEDSLVRTVRGLLEDYRIHRQHSEQQHMLERRNRDLESLTDVGLAMAGCFDIATILERIQTTAAQLLHTASVEVFYAGCQAINSRASWFPQKAQPGRLSLTQREKIRERAILLAEGSRSRDAAPPLEPAIAEILDGASRACYPIVYKDELLGLMIFDVDTLIDGDRAALVSVLGMQAATALRNIHLTQERIHFERLSAIGRMIGSVVHDFRSPLTALRGYAGMLANLELTPEDRKAYGELALEESDRLNHMVNELLEYTRGGSMDLSLRSVSMAPYLKGLPERIHRHFPDKDIEVELDLRYEGELDLDVERIYRALWNITTNACQAIQSDGTLWIRTGVRDGMFSLEIEDSGCGIPSEIQHRIFEPFFSYGKSEGIGLGMALTRKIVEEHGGELSLSSVPGSGTRVRLLLPLRTMSETPVELGEEVHHR